jgi:hypothetical protein
MILINLTGEIPEFHALPSDRPALSCSCLQNTFVCRSLLYFYFSCVEVVRQLQNTARTHVILWTFRIVCLWFRTLFLVPCVACSRLFCNTVLVICVLSSCYETVFKRCTEQRTKQFVILQLIRVFFILNVPCFEPRTDVCPLCHSCPQDIHGCVLRNFVVSCDPVAVLRFHSAGP